MTKEQIFDDINQFNEQELLQFIQKGLVTLDELLDPEEHEPLSKKVRDKLVELVKDAEPNDWDAAIKANTIEAFQDYLNRYPEGNHRQEARDAINRIKQNKSKENEESRTAEYKRIWDSIDKKNIKAVKDFINNYPDNEFRGKAQSLLFTLKRESGIQRLKKKIRDVQTNKEVVSDPSARILELIEESINQNLIEIDDILDEIEDNNNFIDAWVVKELIRKDYFYYQDLEDLGIKSEFVQQMIDDTQRTKFAEPQKLSSFSRSETTEIYFWGIPSSGKSCALGAILSVAGSGKIAKVLSKDRECQGYDYMNRLPLCFPVNGTVSVLPEGTPPFSTYEMGFDLTDQKEFIHPITCVDFAGELIGSMFKANAKQSLKKEQQEALDTLTTLLISNRTTSRKIHFFVVEYGAENRLIDGLPQDLYLTSSLDYIKAQKDNKGRNVFKTSTDAIFLIVTKVDKIKAKRGEDKGQILVRYIQDYFQNFYNSLKQICEQNQINGGKLTILPFSLGKVCFQNYCMFNDSYAKSIVKIIMERSDGFRCGKRGLIESILKK